MIRAQVLSLSLQLTALPGSGAPTPNETYWTTVASFAGERSADAVNAIDKMSAPELEKILRDTERLSRSAFRCENCDARRRFDALPLRTAFLVHGAADRINRAGLIALGRAPDCSNSMHSIAQVRLFALLAAWPRYQEFSIQTSTGMSLLLRSLLCFDSAQRFAEMGIKVNEKSAILHFADGLAQEAMGTLSVGVPPERASLPRRAVSLSSQSRDDRVRLELAEDAFERTVILEPEFPEAHMRRGRVLWRLGKLPLARASLEIAIRQGRGTILYLAHLFLGQVLADLGDLQGAIAEYHAARQIDAAGQTAGVALAQALTLSGDLEGAREALEPLPQGLGYREKDDPFWSYLIGSPLLSERIFEGLRTESLR